MLFRWHNLSTPSGDSPRNIKLEVMALKEATIYRPNSTKKEATISSPISGSIVNVLAERLGQEAAERAKKTFAAMNKNDIDLAQLRIGDRRVRLKA